ncbi:MAG: ABC transporter ATP-binding protein [Candidatus Roizmanbacteria bacterium]
MISFKNVDKYFYFQHQKTVKEFIQAIFVQQKTLEKVHALKHISFEINKGESVGIVGRNGAGKSTLLKLIANVSQPTKGKVEISGRIAPLIELGAGFHPELTGMENIVLNGVILGLKESYIKSKVEDIVEFAEIRDFIDVPIKYYSSGMYLRLAFSVAIFTDPEILLLDEILSVGDALFQDKCIKKMKEFKEKNVTMILVSHSSELVKNFCDRVLYLKHGELKYDGPVEEGLKMYNTET